MQILNDQANDQTEKRSAANGDPETVLTQDPSGAPCGEAAAETADDLPAAESERRYHAGAPEETPAPVSGETPRTASPDEDGENEDRTSEDVADNDAADEDAANEDGADEDRADEDSANEERTNEDGAQPEESPQAPLSEQPAEEKKESPALFLFDLFELIAVSLAVVMLLLTFVMRLSPVIGSSMYPTILGRRESGESDTSGKDVLIISDTFYTPASGDIIVIQTPTLYKGRTAASMDHSIVKRVIAVGGDTMTIDFENWRIEVNGEVFEEGYGKAPYVNYGAAQKKMDEGYMATLPDLVAATVSHEGSVYTVKIPEGKLFVMGDNRNNSTDSRRIGLIDERWVAGRSLVRVYPFDRFGTVD